MLRARSLLLKVRGESAMCRERQGVEGAKEPDPRKSGDSIVHEKVVEASGTEEQDQKKDM